MRSTVLLCLVSVVAGMDQMEKIVNGYAMHMLWESCIGEDNMMLYKQHMHTAFKTCKHEYKKDHHDEDDEEEEAASNDFTSRFSFGARGNNNPFSALSQNQGSIFSNSPFQSSNRQSILSRRLKRQISNNLQHEVREGIEKVKKKLEMKGKFKDCVLRELGMVDVNGAPDVLGIKADINKYNVPLDLKKQFTDDVDICAEMTQCVPNKLINKAPLSRQNLQKMMFFTCVKKQHTKTCIQTDLRKKLTKQIGYVSKEDMYAALMHLAQMSDKY